MSKVSVTNGLFVLCYLKLKDQKCDVLLKSPPLDYVSQSNSHGLPDPLPTPLPPPSCLEID